ncbi:hypothetical protein [Amycolatopsis decaplanina]|uniref:hypothetical protein n=1 Tax=Amycolatopsis decaplanina TaxID=208441 RepID=UPI00034B1E94|nr:hypothetical protein [Amycolatopsis decaplanina]
MCDQRVADVCATTVLTHHDALRVFLRADNAILTVAQDRVPDDVTAHGLRSMSR